MPRITGKEERNLKIIKFLDHHDWSFQLVADKFGITRNVVAGIMFRHRYPIETLGAPCSGKRNKHGKGWQRAKYYPSVNANNSRMVGGA